MAQNWNNRKEELLVRLLRDIMPEGVASDTDRGYDTTDVRWSDVVAVGLSGMDWRMVERSVNSAIDGAAPSGIVRGL